MTDVAALLQGMNKLASHCYVEARERGFYADYEELYAQMSDGAAQDVLRSMFISQRVGLIASELGELIDALRKPKVSEKIPPFSEVEEELADAVIRILDFAGFMGIDLQSVVAAKLEMNRSRERLHGGLF